MEWKSKTLPAYRRRTKEVEALIAGSYLSGTNQWMFRVQRLGLRLLKEFEDRRALEDRALVDSEHRRLAERRDGLEPIGLVREVIRSNGTDFSISEITALCT